MYCVNYIAVNEFKADDEVTLRFVHEVETGDKVYKVDDWVSYLAV